MPPLLEAWAASHISPIGLLSQLNCSLSLYTSSCILARIGLPGLDPAVSMRCLLPRDNPGQFIAIHSSSMVVGRVLTEENGMLSTRGMFQLVLMDGANRDKALIQGEIYARYHILIAAGSSSPP